MIKTSLDDFKKIKTDLVIKSFKDGIEFDEIIKKFNINRNDLICILYDYFQDDVNLAKYVASTTINNDKFMVIADTHFGFGNESMRRVKKLYRLCEKVGIKNIIIAGDLFNGKNKWTNKKYVNKEEQVNLFY